MKARYEKDRVGPEVLLRTTPLAAAGLKARVCAVGCGGHGGGVVRGGGGDGGGGGGGAGLQVGGWEAQALPSKQGVPVAFLAWQKDANE